MSCLLKQFQDEMLQWKILAKKTVNISWFNVRDFNILDIIYKIYHTKGSGTLNSLMFRGGFSPSLNNFVLTSLQVDISSGWHPH